MRKLATAALAFSAAVFLANYILPVGWLIVPAVLAAAAGALLALLHRRWLTPAVLALVFFSLGLLHYALYSRLTLERAAAFDGQTVSVTGRVLDYPDVYDGYVRLLVRLEGGELPHFKAVVYDNEKLLADAQPGDRIRFTAKISLADTLYGRPYDNYIVNGVFFRLNIRGEIGLTRGGFSLRTLPVRLRHFLCSRVDTVFPADVRSFLKALMLGERDEFYADDALYVSMTRSGLMHVVAVSGLHVAFLVGLLQFILGKGRTGTLAAIAAVWCFALVTGAGQAAVRAGFMQTLLLLAPLLRRENDPLTSLSAVLALCLCASPFAARSVSLQLSYAAMAGILCFFDRIEAALEALVPERLLRRPTRYLLASAAGSLSVLPFTVPLTAWHFGYVPLLSPLSNPLCLWAVSLSFSGAWLSTALSVIPVLGRAAGWLCAWPVRYLQLCARTIAAFPYSVLYTQTRGAWLWIGVSYALLIPALLLRKRRFVRALVPGLVSLALLVGVFACARRDSRTRETVSVLNVGQGQCITAFAGDSTAVIDCGNTGSLDNAGALAGEYLLSRGRTGVDVLLLTHLHADHADGAVRLMETLPVGTLVLPADADDSDGLYKKLLACAERRGTKITELDADSHIQAGALSMDVYRLPGGESENERCLLTLLHAGTLDVLITADVPESAERRLAAAEDLSGIDVLIVGHHGSKYASGEELLREVGGRTAVVSVGWNTYGHPAEETLERLAAYGYTVHRTDLEGNIEIRQGELDGQETR
ncbi:MAG: ComEC/Rec2 family competence protein [Oscillospiraceae bacterium]|nr:ComEC/Rec2 family competence protein [Oscillospiraceae bacterium]